MAASTGEPTSQLGLLDLSVDLSVPEIYAGTDFTLYLHVKNPFAVPVWIQTVEVSLPTQLKWLPAPALVAARKESDRAEKERSKRIRVRNKKVLKIRSRLAQLGPAAESREPLEHQLISLIEENDQDERQRDFATTEAQIKAAGDSRIEVNGVTARRISVDTSDRARIEINGIRWQDETERVPLAGSLPKGAALQPGCTDVWTIRIGSSRSPLFVPAKYNLQVTVIYALEAIPERVESAEGEEEAVGAIDRRLFANTTAFTAQIKSAVSSVILGGVGGGVLGSFARSLQEAKTLGNLADHDLGSTLGALLLALILSGAAIVFSARKSDAQSFVTVEDFWGGLLIGFLVGYSGTAAFASLTGIHGG